MNKNLIARIVNNLELLKLCTIKNLYIFVSVNKVIGDKDFFLTQIH